MAREEVDTIYMLDLPLQAEIPSGSVTVS